MKYKLIIGSTFLIMLAACNNESQTSEKKNTTAAPVNTNVASESPLNGLVSAYLNLKNALANDDAKLAASASGDISAELKKIDTGSLDVNSKKAFLAVADDLKEHSNHIATNAGDIEHQRRHFDEMSGDMYDLVKASKTGQKLYKDFCPMYNKQQGAIWLSETKDIKNPYMGKNMAECGEVQEEIPAK